MHLGRRGASTVAVAGVLVAIVVVAAVVYLSYSPGKAGTTSSTPTHSTVLCCTTSVSGSYRVFMSLQPTTPLVSSEVVANYTLTVSVLGSLNSPLVLSAIVPPGVSVQFTPDQIQPGSETNSVMVSFEVSTSAPPSTLAFNVTASSPGGTNSQMFNLEVVRYLVVTVGESFIPDSLSVPAGSTVYWMRLNGAISQYDDGSHNVVFDSLQASSPTLGQYQSWSHTFDQAGTFTYECTFHPGMTGQVTVT